jgi:predicted DNA-binding protein
MNTSTSIRTSITLPPALFQRLRDFAAQKGKTMSQIVEDGVKRVIQKDQEIHLRQVYETLKELDGAGGKGITDASTTINDVLYGDNGAWKGRNE